MKTLFLVSLVLLFVISPAYGQSLSDATGLVTRLDVKTGGHTFEVETVSNFNIQDFNFDKNEKKLSLFINSGLERNLGELLIPRALLGGNFTFYLNEQPYFPKVHSNEKISFVTLNFTGSGENKLEIFGTTHLDGLTAKDEITAKYEITPEELPPLQQGETLPDSLGWLILVGFLAVVSAIVVVKIKKQKS
ncbi:MAG: hypothetical protein K5798_03485 [Nitrosopumilus sp.]|uniref:hypothetical protein n=1 Tax=Nitrosopumilus sp. TaxID=2024843 RepID=UPI00242E767C|nr:hypothetical protein [Nitrosopumilus sp.]MCV0366314.1 hypothetical protein [Nitrosopumilus sp.]